MAKSSKVIVTLTCDRCKKKNNYTEKSEWNQDRTYFNDGETEGHYVPMRYEIHGALWRAMGLSTDSMLCRACFLSLQDRLQEFYKGDR